MTPREYIYSSISDPTTESWRMTPTRECPDAGGIVKLESTYLNPRNGKRYHQWAISEDPRTGRTTLIMRQLFGNADSLIRFESEVKRWQKATPTHEDLAFYLEHIAAR